MEDSNAKLGEQFDEPGVIGASLSLRSREHLVQIWLKDGRDDKLRVNVGNKLRHFLNLNPVSVTLFYKQHVQSIKDGSTMKNAEGFKFIKNPPPRQSRQHYPRPAFEQDYRQGKMQSRK